MNSSLRSTLVLVVVTLVLSGCPSGPSAVATVPSSLQSVRATGAVAGAKGKLRLQFDNPLGADLALSLKSSAPAVADVAASVTAPRGSLNADFEYDAKTVGSADLYVTTGDTTLSTTVTVVDKVRLNYISSYGNSQLEVGAQSSIVVSLNIDPATPVTVALTSETPSVLTTASSLIISPFANTPYSSNNNRSTVTAVAEGSTVVHAKLDDVTYDAPFTVVSKARLSDSSSGAFLEVGGSASLNLYVDALVAAPTSVTVTSSNPAVVPSTTITIPTGQTYAAFRVTAAAAGDTVLHCVLGSSSADLSVVGVASPTLTNTSLSALKAGAPGFLSLTFNVIASKSHSLTVTSSDTSVITVPATVTLLPGTSTVSVPVTPLKNGSSDLKVSFEGHDQTVAAVVSDTSNAQLNMYGQDLAVGGVGYLQIYGTGQGTLLLTSSDPTVLALPASTAFSNNLSLMIKGLKAGVVQVTATLGGRSIATSIRVLEHAALSWDATYSLDVGAKLTTNVYLSAIPPSGTAVTFTTSNAAVVPAPAPVTFHDQTTNGAVTFEGLTTGTAVITAMIGTAKQSAVVYVGSANPVYPLLENFYGASTRMQVGAITVATAQLSDLATSELPFTIEYSTPGIVDVPGGLQSVPVGAQTTTLPIRALMAGSTDVTLTRDGVSLSVTITVVAMPTFSLYVPGSLQVGETAAAYANVDCMLAADVILPLVSGTPATATVSVASAVFRPGLTGATANFVVKGVAAGTATIKLGTGAETKTGMVVVTP